MAEHDSERAWDEYDWERFLQQQDQKTEKYMELLEKYLDDPQRDQIIAREMGWTHLLENREWSSELDSLMDDPEADESLGQNDEPDEADTFEDHTLYRAAFALTI